MKMIKTCLLLLSCLLLHTKLMSQVAENRQRDTLRIVFYNTENLYDPFNDSLTLDDDFLPTATRAWGFKKFRTKIINISKALIAAGEWKMPGIIGLCEIENEYVLKQLVNHSPLQKQKYHVIHQESPDPRGVDVALLYDPQQYKVFYSRAIPMTNPQDTVFKTRDILYTKGLIFNTDTLHVFVNHWPSKYGGIASSLVKRKFVAHKLRTIIDSIQLADAGAKILLMGDFNDGPAEEVMQDLLINKTDFKHPGNNILINLMSELGKTSGSHKFRGEWTTLDQFILSLPLTNSKTKLLAGSVKIVNDNFLLENDDNYSGHKPYRTYAGPRYLGGYSDHLPIRLDLISPD